MIYTKRGAGKLEKTCPICSDKYFTYKSHDSKTCSPECGHKLRSANKKVISPRLCQNCGIKFIPCRMDIPGLFCSRGCAVRMRSAGIINRKGYVYILTPDHPNATSQGYVGEHRLIMEAHIGRYLTKNEIVHHLNHERSDNHIDNLQLMTISKHSSHHAKITRQQIKSRYFGKAP